MNRQIEFRTWVKDKGMFYFTIEELLQSTVHSEGVTYSGGDMTYVWRNGEKMQYTGLKDKNNNKIYEGDIIIFEDLDTDVRIGKLSKIRIATVEYDIYKMRFGARVELMGIMQFYPNFTEVMGNIYENKDLLPNNK